MTAGVISSFDNKSSSGFIRPDDGTPDVFFHISEIERAGWAGVELGSRISFDKKYDRLRDRSFAINLAHA
jgi:CspA family cold shock protein